MADAKMEALAEALSARIDELVPISCREKSLATTNLEQAILWAEKARQKVHPARKLTVYSPDDEHHAPHRRAGWLGFIEGASGPEGMVRESDGEVVPVARLSFRGGTLESWIDADGQVCAPDGSPLSAEAV